MNTNNKLSATSTCILCVVICSLAKPVSNKTISTAPVTLELQTSVTTLNQEEITTESITLEVAGVTTETSLELTQNVNKSGHKPVEGNSTNSPLSTHEATTTHKPMQSSTESSTEVTDNKRDGIPTDKTSLPVVTSKLTTTPAVQTEPPVTTAHIPTEQATTKRLQLTTHKKATQSPLVVTTRTLATEKHQAEKTEENHPGGTGENHEGGDNHHDTRSTIKPSPDTNKNDTGNGWFNSFSNNSLVSKLMLPVILGVVAAFVIVCFAYGVRSCRNSNRGRGRRKTMQNGQDHDMGSNFDRIKLLADSSEDEF